MTGKTRRDAILKCSAFAGQAIRANASAAIVLRIDLSRHSCVIASEAKQSISPRKEWIASSLRSSQ